MTDAGPFVQAVDSREIEKKKEEKGGGTDTLFLPVQIRHSALFVSYLVTERWWSGATWWEAIFHWYYCST